jgi:hypothetical protein
MWGEIEEEDGYRWSQLKRHGAIAGHVQQFASNAPTTYAWALGGRIGAFESWEAAKSAIEKATGFHGPHEDSPTETERMEEHEADFGNDGSMFAMSGHDGKIEITLDSGDYESSPARVRVTADQAREAARILMEAARQSDAGERYIKRAGRTVSI